MTGKYDIEIYNKRVHYHLTVKRNITVIQGDSATGKTELLRMISDYENNGISSGITTSILNCLSSSWRHSVTLFIRS